jgi:GNAT superfamily N-acetyltransferase
MPDMNPDTIEDSEISLPRPPVVTIRSAKPHDLPELKEMIAALAAHHNDPAAITPEVLERDLFGSMPWITALVAEAGAQLIGYAILVPLYRAQEGQRGMDLHHLFVRDGHRGHGIGQHLVARARELARNAGCGYLSVSAATGNSAAHRFYEQMDFKPRPVTGMRYMQALA